jgi:hypothetical protein
MTASTRAVSVRLSPESYASLSELAWKHRWSVSAAARYLIEGFLNVSLAEQRGELNQLLLELFPKDRANPERAEDNLE